MKVRDVMTPDPITIDPEAPLGTATALMRSKGIRHLPVVDEAGRLVGVITDRDLRQATVAPALAEHLSEGGQRRLRGLAQALEDVRVRDAMTWAVATIDPEATVQEAALRMFERRVGSLPVVRDGRLVGILTERDLLRALAREHPAVSAEVEAFLW
jgi:acetoin utilization protein AcuB